MTSKAQILKTARSFDHERDSHCSATDLWTLECDDKASMHGEVEGSATSMRTNKLFIAPFYKVYVDENVLSTN
jgi:hypothetical protein